MPGADLSRLSPEQRPLILHVLHHLVIGGMENGLVNLINHLPADRYRHMVACIEDYSDFRNRIQRADVDVLALRRSVVGAQGVRRAIFGLCRRVRPALVHTRALSGLDALLPARLAGVRHTVHSEHGWDVDNLNGQQWKPALLRRLHRPLVSHFITVSKDIEQFLVRRIGVPAARITQIYNGVDTQRFVPVRPRPVPAGMPPGFLGPQTVCFGTVGRLQPVKDQATLLRAFAHMLAEQPALRATARLVVVGDGPLHAALHALQAQLGLGDVAWLPGSSSQVPSFLQMFDAFVLPSLNEGISNTILEAMACGLPVLASRVGGNVELVQDGVGGAHFAAGDVAGLAGLMRRYAEQNGMRQEQGLAARHAAEARFSLDSMVDAYDGVYRKLRGAP
jgi:sugar transferase (PEP-CTERM/EpsH1 system associated)